MQAGEGTPYASHDALGRMQCIQLALTAAPAGVQNDPLSWLPDAHPACPSPARPGRSLLLLHVLATPVSNATYHNGNTRVVAAVAAWVHATPTGG